MWLANFPGLLHAARGWLWHESMGLSAHREGEYLPREWQTYTSSHSQYVSAVTIITACVQGAVMTWEEEKYHCVPSLDVVCTDKAPSFHPLGFMCFLILVSSIS